jgi:hypothetical protein
VAAHAAGVRNGRIFLSYRRDDTLYLAGRLYDHLAHRFGHANVFMDVASMMGGDKWVEAIRNAVGSCQVLLVLIGPRWLDIRDEHGHRRLNDPDDVVALEITTALEHGIRVIPVLVDGVSMPRPTELPVVLARLADRHALHIHHQSFGTDVGILLEMLERSLPPTPSRPHARQFAPAAQSRTSDGAWPDPDQAKTGGDFLAILRRTCIHAGSPSPAEIVARTGGLLQIRDVEYLMGTPPGLWTDRQEHWILLSYLLAGLGREEQIGRWESALDRVLRADPERRRLHIRRRLAARSAAILAIVGVVFSGFAGGVITTAWSVLTGAEQLGLLAGYLAMIGALRFGQSSLLLHAWRNGGTDPRASRTMTLGTALAFVAFGTAVLYYHYHPETVPLFIADLVGRLG